MAVESCKPQNSSQNSTSSSSSNSSQGGEQECPLCLETLDLDDRSFFPCTCGYQICRFCWHRILSESSLESKGSCPACRKPYSENPAKFNSLSVEDVQQKLKLQKKQNKDQQKKNKGLGGVDGKKHLGELRVVQKNLVFVVGITPKIADPDLLKKPEYFGRFGKIYKIVVNRVGEQNVTTPQGTTQTVASFGAYITYTRSEDALRAIQSVNNLAFDGKTIKASLGTTKYCSHFMRNQPCPKPDCMYLHSLGDQEASFTKEDMQQGKHQEYERKLLEEFNKDQERLEQQQKQQQVQQQLLKQREEKIMKVGGSSMVVRTRKHTSSGCSSSEEEEQIITNLQQSKGLSVRDVVMNSSGQRSNSKDETQSQQGTPPPTSTPILTNGHHPPVNGYPSDHATPSPPPHPQLQPQPSIHPQQIKERPTTTPHMLNILADGGDPSTLLTPTELLTLADVEFDPFRDTQGAFESIIRKELEDGNQPRWHNQKVSPPPGFCNNNRQDIWGQQQQPDDWIDPAIIFSSAANNAALRPQAQNLADHFLGNSLLNDIFCGNNAQQNAAPTGHQDGQGLMGNGTGLGLNRHLPPFNHHPHPIQQLPHGHGHHSAAASQPPTPLLPPHSHLIPQQPPLPFLQQNYPFGSAPPAPVPKFAPPPGFPSSSSSSASASATPTPISSQQQTQFINNNFFNNYPF